jgi:hypothetical protein
MGRFFSLVLVIFLNGCGGPSVPERVEAYLHDSGFTHADVRSCERTGQISVGARVYNCGIVLDASGESGVLGDAIKDVHNAIGLEQMCFAVQDGRVEAVDC